MDNDNFVQKFNSDNRRSHNSYVFPIIFVAFISAVLGAICTLLIYSKFYTTDTISEAAKSSSTVATYNAGANLEQVSLNDYTDTAVYAANKALPSMVSISVEYEVSYFGMKQSAKGSGSGVIISKDGYILTNNHVISTSDSSSFYQVTDAKSVTVTLYNDKTEYPATVVGCDSKTDLAVLKIDKTDLVAAEFGDSGSIKVGEFVLAVGDPYGLDHSVTAGIISALNREMTVENTVYNVIQADCAINSGNSGGALVNSKGEVIGITTLKLAGNGIEGVSFAIPINDTIDIYKELIANGKIARPFVGISGIDLDEATAIRNGLTKGIYVNQVLVGGAAEQSGIKVGDVIVKFDGKDVLTMDELNEIKNEKNIGDKLEIVFYRKNEEIKTTLTLGEE